MIRFRLGGPTSVRPGTPLLFFLFYHTLFFSLGPLLPEHLDVQNIPVSKRGELTVYLCGKLSRTGVR